MASKLGVVAFGLAVGLVLAAPARAELAFVPERARLACNGAAPVAVAGHGNAVVVPPKSDAELRACQIEIDYAVRDAALAARAAVSGYVELIGLGLARATFPSRFAVNRGGIVSTVREGGLTLVLAAEGLFAGERQNGAALIFGWRSGEGADSVSFISSTVLIERADRPLKRTGN